MTPALIAALQALISGAWSVLGSRLGQVGVAFAIAWGWSHYRTDAAWQARVAAERVAAEAAYRAEVQRQELATRELAAEATARLADETRLADDLRRQIEASAIQDDHNVSAATLPGKRAKGSTTLRSDIYRPCVVDGDLARVVRRLDASARPPKPSRPSPAFRARGSAP